MATVRGTSRTVDLQPREAVSEVLQQAKREAVQRILAQPSPVSASAYAVSTTRRTTW
jgi:hypothetical protein